MSGTPKKSLWKRMKRKVADAIGLTARRRLVNWIADCKALFPYAVTSVLDANRQDVAFTPELRGKGLFKVKWDLVKIALPGLDLSEAAGKDPDFCFIWGFKPNGFQCRVLATAIRTGATLVLCEDGFLRSADTYVNKSAPMKYRLGCSVIFDTKGFYFDATRPNNIEGILNDKSLVVTPEQLTEARRLIDRIVSEKLTKYNHQPIFAPEIGRPGRRKVLVVDQSYGDMAIEKGWGSDQLFADILEDAKRENPDADILVKTHPDTMTGAKGGYYVDVKEEGNVFRVTMPVNPYSLMEIVDKVYVCSTQMGFEALMAGKEVHVYGMPFYAGWGLTIDKQTNPRRTNKRTLEEVFYIFYILYTHWVDIETGKSCTIDKAMDNLIALREEYRKVRADKFC